MQNEDEDKFRFLDQRLALNAASRDFLSLEKRKDMPSALKGGKPSDVGSRRSLFGHFLTNSPGMIGQVYFGNAAKLRVWRGGSWECHSSKHS